MTATGRNEIYHILFDGTVTDEHGFVAIGGHAERSPPRSRTPTSSSGTCQPRSERR